MIFNTIPLKVFKEIFDNLSEPRCIIKISNPEYIIHSCNKSYSALLNFSEDNIIGKSASELLNNHGINDDNNRVIKHGIQKAIQSRKEVRLDRVKYNMLGEGGGYEEKWWQAVLTPLLENDEVGYIMITCHPIKLHAVEDQIINRHRVQNSEAGLRNLIMNARYGLMILKGQQWLIEIANQQIANMWDKTLADITGKTLMEVLPELKDQPFPALLKKVYDTGISFGEEEQVFYLDTPSGKVKKYVSYHYDPFLDADNKVVGVIVSAHDVTEFVKSKQLLEDSYEKQQVLNEELTVTNEELLNSNEELATLNKQLDDSQRDLSKKIIELAESEAKFKKLVQKAPVAIGISVGPDFIIESANDEMLMLLGKPPKIIGNPTFETFPELKTQPIFDILKKVYETEKPYYGDEQKVYINRDGELKEGYYNFIYQPIENSDGDIAIMNVAFEVTEQVRARENLIKTQETLNLAIKAAELGTFDLDLIKGTMYWNDRCKELFGISQNKEVSYDDDFINGIHPDDRDRVQEVINNVYRKDLSNGDYDIEYRTIRLEDHRARWIRAKGKAYFDENDKPVRFVGAALDITEQKMDEMRKNDFIGMVSHELKTPLTSLTAIVQMLQGWASKKNENFAADSLSKVNKQVKKMSSLINSFLNVSRLEAGKIHLVKEYFRLDVLVSELIEETLITSSTHIVNLKITNAIEIYADKEKISAVITNLLSNAIKYSPKGQSIEVETFIRDSKAVVSVSDNGIGIPQNAIEKLFERFYRVESNYTKIISGFGIGLYLSAEIIERHQGKIVVQSKIGEGSTFYFELPLSTEV